MQFSKMSRDSLSGRCNSSLGLFWARGLLAHSSLARTVGLDGPPRADSLALWRRRAPRPRILRGREEGAGRGGAGERERERVAGNRVPLTLARPWIIGRDPPATRTRATMQRGPSNWEQSAGAGADPAPGEEEGEEGPEDDADADCEGHTPEERAALTCIASAMGGGVTHVTVDFSGAGAHGEAEARAAMRDWVADVWTSIDAWSIRIVGPPNGRASAGGSPSPAWSDLQRQRVHETLLAHIPADPMTVRDPLVPRARSRPPSKTLRAQVLVCSLCQIDAARPVLWLAHCRDIGCAHGGLFGRATRLSPRVVLVSPRRVAVPLLSLFCAGASPADVVQRASAIWIGQRSDAPAETVWGACYGVYDHEEGA